MTCKECGFKAPTLIPIRIRDGDIVHEFCCQVCAHRWRFGKKQAESPREFMATGGWQ